MVEVPAAKEVGAGASCGRGKAKRRGARTRRLLTAQSAMLLRLVPALRPKKPEAERAEGACACPVERALVVTRAQARHMDSGVY
jgi:hypothetical protein